MNTTTAKQLIKYGLIGLAVNSMGYGAFILATYFGVPPKIAMTVLYVAGVGIGYMGNRNWTFGHTGNHLQTSTKYFVAYGTGYLINLSLLYFGVDKLDYPYQLVQLAAIIIVAIYLFVVLKMAVFKA